MPSTFAKASEQNYNTIIPHKLKNMSWWLTVSS